MKEVNENVEINDLVKVEEVENGFEVFLYEDEEKAMS